VNCQFVTISSLVVATGGRGDNKAVQEKPNSIVTVVSGEGGIDKK
jgi:hypothetical protein